MPYSNITHYPRRHDAESYPLVGHIEMEAVRWGDFDRIVGDQTQAQVLGHEDLGEFVVAHVGCTSAAVLRRLIPGLTVHDLWSIRACRST